MTRESISCGRMERNAPHGGRFSMVEHVRSGAAGAGPGCGAGDDGQAQSRPRAASLHGLAFSLEDAIASGFPQARYFSFSPVETEPAPLGEQDRDSLHSPDFPKGQSLCVFASSFSLRALKISWLFSQPLSPSTHGEHSLLTVLCSRSLLSLSQSSEGCSATVLL